MIENLTEPLRSEVSTFVNLQPWQVKRNGNGNGHKNGNGTKRQRKFQINESKRHSRFITRCIDIVGGLIGFILSLPVFIVTYLLILITSGRPVIFTQQRLGRHGKVFKIFKFRTMRKDAEDILEEHEELYKKYIENDYKLPPEEDPRVIWCGNFLRKYSIDEIPQFINVLKGEMSLVGPRPIVPQEIERYENYESEFLSVKPGLTGLWQVTGRSEIGYPDRLFLDLVYIEKRNAWLDLRIFLKTILVVLKRAGAH